MFVVNVSMDIRSTRCKVKLYGGSLKIDLLTKRQSEITEPRATTGNVIVLNFCTFSWFLSKHHWLFLIPPELRVITHRM